jgi:hypothetical protein
MFGNNGYVAKIPTEIELREMYLIKRMSLSEIAEISSFKTHKILYWMDKYGIGRRNRSEANYIKANPKGEPFKIKHGLTRNEVKLKYLALGLYWGEGSKMVRHATVVTNSDPMMIKTFYDYLIGLCGVKKEKIKLYLQTFKDNDVDTAKSYWAGELKINGPVIHTGKPIGSQGKGTYKKLNKHGVMQIAFFNTHFKSYLMNELRKLGMK